MLRWVLDRQTATLLVAVATLALTVLLYIVIPKGFFPVQDTGLIQGISEAPQSISFAAMAERQQALAAAILKDPDVESLSSFIGVDGTNITLNSGRFLINLKPHDERTADVTQIIRRITQATQDVPGITLYMQPVQDLTIDATVSRTQYQFSLEDANPQELAAWAPRLVDKLNSMPQFSQVSSDISANGLSAYIDIDRDTAGRFGITPATIDNALYDSFGQRIVSTIFTQSNQYRVILETDPKLQARSTRSPRSTCRLDQQRLGPGPGAAVGDRDRARGHRAAAHQPPRPVSRRPRSRSTSRRAPRSATPSTRSSRRARRSGCRSAPSSASRARRWRSRRRCRTSCC